MNSIDVSEAAGVRYLHFGSDWVQGAMRIARPYALELDYTREMMMPLLLREETWPRRVLIIGLGAASVLKFLWRYRPQASFVVVEIDPRIEIVARHSFKFPDDPERVHLHIGDGADYVAATHSQFDLILVDGFDAQARAGRLDTLPFYLGCKSRLSRDGLLCVNLLSRRKNFSKSISILNDAFDQRVLFMPSCDSGNAIAIAAVPTGRDQPAAWPEAHELRDAAISLRESTHLNLLPTLSRLAVVGHLPTDRQIA